MKDNQMTITTEEGKQVVCKILFTYVSEEFGKKYVVFQPEGEKEASAAIYVEHGDGSGDLQAVETDEEWEMLENLFDDYFSSESGCDGQCGNCDGCDSEECECQ